MDSNDINVGVSSTNDALHRSPGVVRNMQGCRAFTESNAPCLCPGVVLSEQRFPHHGRVWVKKLVRRTNSKRDSGTEHKIDIENNKKYIEEDQLGRSRLGGGSGLVLEMLDHLQES